MQPFLDLVTPLPSILNFLSHSLTQITNRNLDLTPPPSRIDDLDRPPSLDLQTRSLAAALTDSHNQGGSAGKPKDKYIYLRYRVYVKPFSNIFLHVSISSAFSYLVYTGDLLLNFVYFCHRPLTLSCC